MKRTLLVTIILSIFLLSCEDVFNQRILLDIDPGKEKLVVLCEINSKSPPNVLLTLSGNSPSDLYMNQGGYTPGPEEADVELFENGISLGKLKRNSNSIYNLNYFFLPSPEKTYDIKIKTTEYGEVWASGKMPSQVSLKAEFTGVKKTIRYFNADYQVVEVKVSFKDLSDQRNYYRFGVAPFLFKQDGGVHSSYTLNVFSNDLIYYSTSLFQDGANIGAFSRVSNTIESFTDEEFKNSTKDILIYLDSAELDALNARNNQNSYELFFILDNISEDMHKYYETKTLASDNDGNPFVQPTIIHNNIKGGGIGFFGLFTQNQARINLKDY